VWIRFAVSGGLFCTLQCDDVKLSQELLNQVKAEMEALRDRAIPFKKKSLSTDDAVDLFERTHMTDKAKLFRYRISSRTNVYSLDGFTDYYYGYMVPDSSFLKLFDLRVYKAGFVLLFPSSENPEKIQEFAPVDKLFNVQYASRLWGKKLGIHTVGDLNALITSQGTMDLVLMQEALQEKTIADIAHEIEQRKKVKIVFIAGPSSSGKTTFSHRLSIQLSCFGRKPHPIAMDNYFLDRGMSPKNPDGTYNFECLEALDVEQFNKDMTDLLAGKTVQLPTYNFISGKREYKGNTLRISDEDVLVVEGIHGLNDAFSYRIPAASKYKIYISALTQLNIDEHNRIPTTDGRLLRRIIRDQRTRGYDAQNTIRIWKSVRRGEEEYIFPFQESADVMFNSALVYELAVLKTYAQPLLHAVPKDSPEWVEAKRLLKFLDYFLPIPADEIPSNSLIREFIGGGCFDI
jgi:uridine kinase